MTNKVKESGRLSAQRVVALAAFMMLALCLPSETRAQWTTSGTTTSTTDSVGVGTADPTSSGKVGAKLIVAATDETSTAIATSNGTSPRFALNNHSDGSWTMHDFTNNSWTAGITQQVGRVGIGTFQPGFHLDVQGGKINASGGFCISGDCKSTWSQISPWTATGGNLFYNMGNVGIGIGTPTAATANSARLVISGTPGSEGLDLATSDQYANLRVIRNSKSTHDKDLYLQYGAGVGSKIRFYTDNAESMTLVNGNLGVGTSAPTARLDVQGDIRASGNISAKYQDVAEWVPTTQKLAAGTVVILDTRNSNHVLASVSAYDTRVAGVISAQPGIMLGEAGESKALVATTGRVKVKVDATRAPIQIGDLIVTSDVAGTAMKSEPIQLGSRQIHTPGTIIGKALEPLEKGTGEILVLLSLQ
jgi:hypothetical protein